MPLTSSYIVPAIVIAFCVFVLYVSGKSISQRPVGGMLASFFILAGRLFARIENLLAVFRDKLIGDSKHPGLYTVYVLIAFVTALAALGAEGGNTILTIIALFPKDSISVPSLPGFFIYAMSALFLAPSMLWGMAWLEGKKAVLEEIRLFHVPQEHETTFNRFVVTGLVLSVLMSVLFYAVKPLFIANPKGGLTLLLQFFVFVLLGITVPMVAILALYIIALGGQVIIALIASLGWFAASVLADTCHFLSQALLQNVKELQGVRDTPVVVEGTSEPLDAPPPTPVIPTSVQKQETISQVSDAQKQTTSATIEKVLSPEEQEEAKRQQAEQWWQRQLQQEKDKEAAFEHIKIAVKDNIRSGMSEEKAVEAALQANIFDQMILSQRSYFTPVLTREEYKAELLQYAQAEKQRYDTEQEAKRKQKEAEEARKQEVLRELVHEMKERARRNWKTGDLASEAAYVLDFCLPNDVVLTTREYQEWDLRLREVAEEVKIEEQEREEETRRHAEEALRQDIRQRFEEHKQKVEKKLASGAKFPYPQRLALPIIAVSSDEAANQAFADNIRKILAELEALAPYRYNEVLQFFPKAEYKPEMAGTHAGRSDGLFSGTGTGILTNGTWLNSYEWFRFVFLHEVGHNVAAWLSGDHSETSADEYAKQVLVEMGIDVPHAWTNRTQNCAPLLPVEQ